MFDEGPHLNMVIRTRGAILGRTKVTSRAGNKETDVLTYNRAIDPFADHTAELSMKAPMSVSKPADNE